MAQSGLPPFQYFRCLLFWLFVPLKNEGRTGQYFFVPVHVFPFLVTTFRFSCVFLVCFLTRTLNIEKRLISAQCMSPIPLSAALLARAHRPTHGSTIYIMWVKANLLQILMSLYDATRSIDLCDLWIGHLGPDFGSLVGDSGVVAWGVGGNFPS